MFRKMTGVILGILMCLANASSQASVVYSFTADSAFDSPHHPIGSFTVTLPTFISVETSFLTLTPDQLDHCEATGTTCRLMFFSGLFGPGHDGIGFGTAEITYYYYFDRGAFTTFGSYDTVVFGTEQSGHLTVAAAESSVPEPLSISLLGLGLLGAVVARKSQRQSRGTVGQTPGDAT